MDVLIFQSSFHRAKKFAELLVLAEDENFQSSFHRGSGTEDDPIRPNLQHFQSSFHRGKEETAKIEVFVGADIFQSSFHREHRRVNF